MTKNVLDYLSKCTGWLAAIQNIHWDANSMSQHKLCDDIKKDFDEFRDIVAEIEQGIDGNIALNDLKSIEYEITDLDKFLKGAKADTLSFYKNLDGDDYIGMRSECESFLGKLQKYIYLNTFCKKKDLDESKKRIAKIISETVKRFLNKKFNED